MLLSDWGSTIRAAMADGSRSERHFSRKGTICSGRMFPDAQKIMVRRVERLVVVLFDLLSLQPIHGLLGPQDRRPRGEWSGQKEVTKISARDRRRVLDHLDLFEDDPAFPSQIGVGVARRGYDIGQADRACFHTASSST